MCIIKKFIFTAVLLFTSLVSFSYEVFTPEFYDSISFEDVRVVLKNIRTKKVSSSSSSYRAYFVECRTDGYYLVLKTFEKDRLEYVAKSIQRFWSLKSRSYEEVTLIDGVKINFGIVNFRAASEELFWGYPEAHDDIINVYGSYLNKKCQHWNMLGRAYSMKAMAVLENNAPIDKFQTVYNPFNIDEERLQRFTQYADLSIVSFTKAAELCPNRLTVVGTYQMKLDQTYMAFFYAFKAHGLAEKAKKYIDKKPLFDEFRLEILRNMLSSCKPNSVFLVEGDADTYMAIYLQEKMNFRQDLVIVNTTLAHLSHYIQFILKNYPQLKTTIQVQLYTDPSTEAIYSRVLSDSLTNLDFGDFAKAINARSEDIYNSQYLTLPCNSLKIGDENLLIEGYIDRSDLFIMDLLFTNPSLNFNISPLSHFTLNENQRLIVNQGLVERIMIAGYSEPILEQMKVSQSIFSDSINFPEIKMNEVISPDEVSLINAVKVFVKYHAEDLILSKQPDKAFAWLGKVRAIYPDQLIEYDVALPDIAGLYYENERKDEAFKIMDILYEVCKKGMVRFDRSDFTQRNFERFEKLHSLVKLSTLFTTKYAQTIRYPEWNEWSMLLNNYATEVALQQP